MAFYQDTPFHAGEEKMHEALHVPHQDNPTVPALSPQLANHLQVAPLIAIGTIDAAGRPWTTLWGNGDKGFARPIANGIIGIRTPVTGKYDPVVEELVGVEATGEVKREEGEGRLVSGLSIDLETRKRVKFSGRMIAGALSTRDDEVAGHEEHIAEIQLVMKIEQSLGNCPKYLNSKNIVSALARPKLDSQSSQLSPKAVDVIHKADMFFLSSSHPQNDMDTNHRGGPPGFLRVVSNEASGAVICYPEYSGNRLYQTLGNLVLNPLLGICIPDYDTGDMLYLTGKADILIGQAASSLLPRSNLAVKVTITACRLVTQALPFRGTSGTRSPYNPRLRYLASEQAPTSEQKEERPQQATLLCQTKLTPTISRYRFALSNPMSHKAGQYVTLDFSQHLDFGYSHMRDEDPQSLNDDFVRTFTVSSPPGDPPNPVKRLRDDEFEITVRNVGAVTGFMAKHWGKESQARGMHELEVGIKGFGGEFDVTQDGKETICFVAAGVGITPLLPALYTLDYDRLRVLWSVRQEDLPLVRDVLDQHPNLAKSLSVFLTDAKIRTEESAAIEHTSTATHFRRMTKSDFEYRDIQKYYLCTSGPMRKQLMEWLAGKELIFEDFNF